MTSIWWVAKCIYSKCTPHQHYRGEHPSTSNAYLSTPMHTLWAKIGWASIFLNNQIPNWRKWPQFESCQIYIFINTPENNFNLKCIVVHSHAHPLSKNWLSQHIFKKQIPNWRKLPQFESCQMYIFKIYSSSTIHRRTTFNLKCIFVHSHAHPLSKNWLSQPIPVKTDSKLTQLTSIWELPNVYFQNVLLTSNTVENNLQPQMHICPLHAHPLSKNWLSQHIPKKQNPNWRKWPQFDSCQMYIFKMSSNAHSLRKNWLSQHIFIKQIPNWRKWPQFESCQMYIFKIYSSSTIHPTITFNLKCICVHSHAHPLSKNWLSQHIPKQQIPNWRKWPQFESSQMYIFKMYSSPAIQWRTTFNLKCIFVYSHCTPFEQKFAESAYF